MTETATDRILLVDDEPALLRGVERLLRQAGFDVTSAEDGQAAQRALETQHFSAIFSDISMPGMNGVALLRFARERQLDLPVILMTGNPRLENAVEAVELGAFRYLIKPVDAEVLVAVARQAVNVAKMAVLQREALKLIGDRRDLLADRSQLSANFDRALASIRMAYQPIIRWPGQAIYGHEALLRSGDPTLSGPAAILEAAERLARLPELGRAIRGAVALRIDAGQLPGKVFVNLHGNDLLDDTLYSADAPLSRHAERVVLEVTERASLDELPDLHGRATRLRKLGYDLAIDDLGAGYAGLNSFALLEPEIVKLDMALVRDIHLHPTKRALVRSMVALCRELGYLVIAEGVETMEERDVLAEVGCELLQGYLFGRPV